MFNVELENLSEKKYKIAAFNSLAYKSKRKFLEKLTLAVTCSKISHKNMIITNKDLKLVIPFILFVIAGIYGIYSVDFISVDQTIETTFKWCILPTVFFALYYAYRSSFGYNKAIAIWKNTLTFIIMTIMIGMVIFVSFRGVLMLINSNIGEQKDYNLRGKIIKLNYPEKKKTGNKYSIFIKRELEKDTIELNVPKIIYIDNQYFEKKMKIGSLKFIYSKE